MRPRESPDILDALRLEPSLHVTFLVEVLSSLVEINTVNPGHSELAAAQRIARWFEGTPAHVHFVDFAPGRTSVAVVLEGGKKGPRLVVNGHLDTVPVDDVQLWNTDPFRAVTKDGYVYGRGACDQKGGLAAEVALGHYVARHIERLEGTLVLHFAAGEERAEPGTFSLLKAGFTGDYGIVTEPTRLRVATAERGLVFYRVRIKGRSSHASRAHLGTNPIARMGPVLKVVELYDAEASASAHPLLPGGSCTPTTVHAGVAENSVPDYLDLTLDRRLLPGERIEDDVERLRQKLAEIRLSDADFDFEIAPTGGSFEAAEIDPDSAWARTVLDAVGEVTGNTTPAWGTPYSSDVRNLINDAGIEAVTFGPGDVAECHCANERVALQELRDAALTLAKVTTELLMAAGE